MRPLNSSKRTQSQSNALVFRPEDHTYWLGDRELIGVNRLLEAEGIRPPYNGDPWYGLRGTYVHQACALYDQGLLDEENLDPQLKGYVEAWKLFKKEFEIIEISAIEEMVYSEALGIAGTLDRRVVIGNDFERYCVIIDLKTSVHSRWHSLQTALYALCIPDHYDRMGLQLKEDGSYHEAWHEDENDLGVARSLIEVHKWKNKFRKRKPMNYREES